MKPTSSFNGNHDFSSLLSGCRRRQCHVCFCQASEITATTKCFRGKKASKAYKFPLIFTLSMFFCVFFPGWGGLSDSSLFLNDETPKEMLVSRYGNCRKNIWQTPLLPLSTEAADETNFNLTLISNCHCSKGLFKSRVPWDRLRWHQRG